MERPARGYWSPHDDRGEQDRHLHLGEDLRRGSTRVEMSDQESTQETQDMPAVEEEPSTGQSQLETRAAADTAGDPLPAIGAAFAGGFVLAKILKKLGGD